MQPPRIILSKLHPCLFATAITTTTEPEPETTTTAPEPETTTTEEPEPTTTTSQPGGGTSYDCEDNNPCTPENIEKERFYFPGPTPGQFVQCSQWGQCYVMNCQPGLVWDDEAYTCNRP